VPAFPVPSSQYSHYQYVVSPVECEGYLDVLICFSAMFICNAGPILRIWASALIEDM